MFPQTEPIAEAARLPMLLPGTRLHVGFGLAIVLAVAMAVVLRYTRFGFQLRSVGASEEAAAVSGGIDVRRILFVSFVGSGAVAGLAGGVEVAGLTHALYENLSPGWGYTAIAVALLAGLNPLGVLATGLLWVGVIEALVILAVLAIDQVRRKQAEAA